MDGMDAAAEYSAIVLGATGNVGGRVVQMLVGSPLCKRVVVVNRRETNAFADLKVVEVVVNLDRLEEEVLPHAQGVDVALAAFGVGKGSAKMAEAEVRKIEVAYPLAFCRAAKAGGVRVCGVTTAAGANPESRLQYARIIGNKEQALSALHFDFLGLYRPGVILGNTNTPGILGKAMPLLDWMMPSKYRAVHKNDLARAMVAQSEKAFLAIVQGNAPKEPTVKILEYEAMRKFLRKGRGVMKAKFIAPMLLLKKERLPESDDWFYQIKLDGYRAIASGTVVRLRSRNDNDFSTRYTKITEALKNLPDETVIDGEVVALDESGRPSFNLLQNHASASKLVYYAFDVLVLKGEDVRELPLTERLDLLEGKVLPKLKEPIRPCISLYTDLPTLIRSVKMQGLEGLVAKLKSSVYEPGLRSGAWQKMRLNQGQEFVIGGYTIGGRTFDALVFGYYENGKLMFAAKTRNGFTPRVREQLMAKFKKLETDKCPFANLPEKHLGRWGQGLTTAKMQECVWLKPELVAQFDFVEWTPDSHLRHSGFIALREDKTAKDVVRET